jgi:hypothetical protein
MIRHYLTCILAVLIAWQSAVAMADTHQLHQSGTGHQILDHDHYLAEADSAANTEPKEQGETDPSGTNPLDCHHCCHCHGTAHFFLGGNPNILINTVLGTEVFDYHFTYLSHTGSPDNPPPIS